MDRSLTKWMRLFCLVTISMLVLFGAITVIIDPYMHFHKPLRGISYQLDNERYMNDGISRQYEYDMIIAGDSMTQNFSVSECDRLFDATTIKLSYPGAGYRELWSAIDRALGRHEVKTVIVNMDGDSLAQSDYMRYENLPEYLYNDNALDDASYIWNTEVLLYGTLHDIRATLSGEATTSLDDYGRFEHETGYDHVMQSVNKIDEPVEQGVDFHPGRKYPVIFNLSDNVVSVVLEHPDTEFIIFMAPVSVAKWCELYGKGEAFYRVRRYETALEYLTQMPNIRLFGFQDCFDITTDLSRYSDSVHYDADVNSQILQMIHDGEHEITVDNYEDYIERIEEFYMNYDYMELCHRYE